MYEAGCYSTQHKFNSLRGDVSGHVDKDRVKKKKKRENERYCQTYNNNNSYIRYNFSLVYKHLYSNTFMTNK